MKILKIIARWILKTEILKLESDKKKLEESEKIYKEGFNIQVEKCKIFQKEIEKRRTPINLYEVLEKNQIVKNDLLCLPSIRDSYKSYLEKNNKTLEQAKNLLKELDKDSSGLFDVSLLKEDIKRFENIVDKQEWFYNSLNVIVNKLQGIIYEDEKKT